MERARDEALPGAAGLPDGYAAQRAAQRQPNLLVQELRESCARARLGGLFYPVAALLVFAAAGDRWNWQAALAIGVLLLLALLRCLVRPSAQPDVREARRKLVVLWSLVLVTTMVWGALAALAFVVPSESAQLVALLFSGAFGMALAHTMCMRTTPAVVAILAVMLPGQVMLGWSVSRWVALMWAVYTLYMLMVLRRSHREFRSRLELEEDLRQQRDLFERQSRVDGLTGLANRRAFGRALLQGVADARGGTPLSLLIIDVDHFKHVNDTLGHLAGDACLVALAQRLRAHFARPGDLPVRLGGEEFGVLLAADAAEALRRAEAFRLASRPAAPVEGGCAVPLPVSIGCGQFDPRRHEDANAFYADVDAALYRAKQAGRDRCQLA